MSADSLSIPWASLVGWILIIAGWFYTNHQNNVRESRKELRSFLDNVIKDIDEVQQKALEYYTKSPDETLKLGFEIKASQQRLIAKIERIGRIHSSFKNTIPVIDFMDSITGNDFEILDRKARSFNQTEDPLLMTISLETNKLIDILEVNYCSEFKKLKRMPNIIKLNY